MEGSGTAVTTIESKEKAPTVDSNLSKVPLDIVAESIIVVPVLVTEPIVLPSFIESSPEFPLPKLETDIEVIVTDWLNENVNPSPTSNSSVSSDPDMAFIPKAELV